MSEVMAYLPSGDRMMFMGRLPISVFVPAGEIFLPMRSWLCASNMLDASINDKAACPSKG